MLTAMAPKSRRIRRNERKEEGLYLYSEYGILCLEPKTESIVRIRYRVAEAFSQKDHRKFGNFADPKKELPLSFSLRYTEFV